MDGNNIHPKHSNMAAIAGVFGLFILLGVFILFGTSSNRDMASPKPKGQEISDVSAKDSVDTPNRELVNFGDVVKDQQEVPEAAGPNVPSDVSSAPGLTLKPNYVTYSESTLDQILEDQGRALLFFHANWCPTCRSADLSIKNEGSSLPENLTILKTDYDKELDLKRKYAVTIQHTFVLVDANMNEITKWQGGGVETIIENLNNPLY